MNTKKDYVRASLGLATAQICHSLGWHSVHRSSHDTLTDVLERYINQVTKTAVNISQTCCRTIPNLDDVALTFEQLGIHLHELQDYVQQVEPCPAVHPVAAIPVKGDSNLMDFSGEDFLPKLIDMTPKVEEVETPHIKQELMHDESLDDIRKEDRPSNLSLHSDRVESPPYSPLEPKSLNVGALNNLDLTRPDLKVVTPKGYTPICTSSTPPEPTVAVAAVVVKSEPGVTSSINYAVGSPKVVISPVVITKKEPITVKSTKKEKKENKKSADKKESKAIVSPPPSKPSMSTPTASSKQIMPPSIQITPPSKQITPVKTAATNEVANVIPNNSPVMKSKKSKSPSPAVDKKDDSLKDNISKCNPSPYLHGSPNSPLFSPPRKKAMYQSDKKKPSKERTKNKDSASKSLSSSSLSDHKISQVFSPKEHKSSEKSSKTKSLINSPLSSSHGSTLDKIRSPPSIKRELSPPLLSSPLIKKEHPNTTVMFPPASSPSPPPRLFKRSDERKEKVEKDTKNISKTDRDKVDIKSPEAPKTSPEATVKVEFVDTTSSLTEVKKEPIESSEHEIDVTSLSQDDSYSVTFKPNMFFPSLGGEEKKKKKKKKSDKQKEQKSKKNGDVSKVKKEKKKKREESASSSTTSTTMTSSATITSSAIPRLTLKMGTETISDAPSKFTSIPRGPCSPNNKFSTAISTSHQPPLSPPMKKKKNKHKQKEKDRERDKEREREKEKEKEKENDKDKESGFYVETLTNTTSAVSGDLYYCPACNLPDDGSPMIGCDLCDEWYHWPCVNIEEEPAEDEKWFCPNCPNGVKKKKKKKKRGDL